MQGEMKLLGRPFNHIIRIIFCFVFLKGCATSTSLRTYVLIFLRKKDVKYYVPTNVYIYFFNATFYILRFINAFLPSSHFHSF